MLISITGLWGSEFLKHSTDSKKKPEGCEWKLIYYSFYNITKIFEYIFECIWVYLSVFEYVFECIWVYLSVFEYIWVYLSVFE